MLPSCPTLEVYNSLVDDLKHNFGDVSLPNDILRTKCDIWTTVSELKEENGILRYELNEVKKALFANKKFYSNAEMVLIVGDGNFSFSFSYALRNPTKLVIATVLERDVREFVNRYGSMAEETLVNLLHLPNACVYFGIDATDTESIPNFPYRDIIFNFPHQGGKTNLRKSRALMRGVFACMSKIMKTDAVFTVTLAPKQGEISARDRSINIHSAFMNIEKMESEFRHKMDSWILIYLAAESGLICSRIDPFDPEDFPEYQASGYRKTNNGFHNEQATMFRFSLTRTTVVNNKRGSFNYLIPYYIHHFSLLFLHPKEEGDLWNDLVKKSLFEFSSKIVFVRELVHLRTRCTITNLPNRVYEIVWQDSQPEGKLQNVIVVDKFREWFQEIEFRDFMLI